MADALLAEPLIGRQTQRDSLTGWVGELVAGGGRAVLLEGEPGIGKSALVRAAAAEARAAGCQVFWAACDELSRAFPLLPLLEALGVRESADDPARKAIMRMLRTGSGTGSAVEPVVAAAEQLLALVDELCGAAPVLLVVDDLQWADPATVLAWARLARSVRQLPLLLVGALRPVPQRDDLRTLRRTVDPDGLLHVQGLPEPEAARLVSTLVAGTPGARLMRLARGASGNPLYLTELVNALARGGRLVRDDGRVEVTGGPTPGSLPDAIADRLEFLSTSARAALRAGALLGVDFSVTELAAVSGRSLTDLLPALDEAIAAGVLRDDGAGLAFRHPLIRTALYDGMPAAVRAAWHRDAGRALARHGAPVERVARQLLPALCSAGSQAGAADDWVVRWLVESARPLIGRAPRVAIPLLRWALAGTPAAAGPHDLLACRLAEALCRVGEVTDAAQVASRALAHAPQPDLVVDLHGTLAQCRATEGRSEESLAALERALGDPGLPPPHRARLLVLVARVHRGLGHVDQAGRVAAEALAEATATGDGWAVGWALAVLTMVHGMRGEVVHSLPLFDRALTVTEGEPALADLRMLLQINQANAFSDLDRYDDAIAAVRHVRRKADSAGNVVRLGQAESLLVELLFNTGRWEEALAEADLVDQSPGAFRDPVVECCRRGIAATITLHHGQGAARHLAALQPYADRLGNRMVYPLALARSLEREQAGAPGQALAVLMEALSRSAEEQAETAPLLPDAVRLAIEVGDLATARAVVVRAATLVDGSTAPYRQATALHTRGLLEHDPVQLLRAADRYEAAGRPLPRVQALGAGGVALADSGDVVAARAQFTHALAGYEALGAQWDLARIQARFRAYGIRRGPQAKHRRVHHGWDALTPTETKIATLVARGMSNPQIAAQLFLSRRTVQSHVSHILTKLGVRSRMDIAREATRRERLPEP
ncbi:AAA family ATPase [Planosporangium thailandense]|uniref:AAA family ATPase n=1 Tax=Planosporangium thailandense TaxID=765197 RepID=A0ABX0Y3K8_9ACTN|nr:AAA family ATPase [Planosporangium thailandense]NJC72012.1 AAA family ATPase [Planosporangium thailandense]